LNGFLHFIPQTTPTGAAGQFLGLPMALVVVLFWLLVFFGVRPAFTGVFQHRVTSH
jgi:hypothetical protein